MTWDALYSLPVLCARYLKGEIETEAEIRRVEEYVTEYRSRLMSVSWYMKKSSGTIFHASPEGVSLRDEATKAKLCWQENAPAILAFTTSMWLDERALLICMAA